jgi:hypothetical protein
VQALAIALALVFGTYEERPYVPCLLVADGERYNRSIEAVHVDFFDVTTEALSTGFPCGR